MRRAANSTDASAASALAHTDARTVIAGVLAVALHWLVLNDIHLNPFDSRGRVVYGEDSNKALFESAVREMRHDVPDARVVVLGGDFLAHHFPALARAQKRDPYRAGEDTIAFIAHTLNEAFPRAQFLVTLGNNDDPCGDYHTEIGGPYAVAIAKTFAPLVNRGGAAPEFVREFSNGGYYTARLPGDVRAVVLNSVLWSFVYRGTCQHHVRGEADAEQAWFAQQLESEKNVIVMHVPPGYDAQSTTTAHRVLAVPFLAAREDAAFRTTLANQDSHVAFVLGAHTHRYDFRIPSGEPMLIASSLSPIYHNNPAFYELTVDGAALLDVQPFVYERFTDEWTHEPSFDAMFGTSRLDGPQLSRVNDSIVRDVDVRTKWNEAYDVWSFRIGDISDNRWQTFACAQVNFGDAYAKCAGTRNRSILAIAILVVFFAAVVFGVGIAIRRRIRS